MSSFYYNTSDSRWNSVPGQQPFNSSHNSSAVQPQSQQWGWLPHQTIEPTTNNYNMNNMRYHPYQYAPSASHINSLPYSTPYLSQGSHVAKIDILRDETTGMNGLVVTGTAATITLSHNGNITSHPNPLPSNPACQFDVSASGSTYRPHKKPKRIRTAYTTSQVQYMENIYQKNKYLDRNQRIELSSILQLAERNIKIWFQNRRMKQKRDENEHLEELAESLVHSTDSEQYSRTTINYLHPVATGSSSYSELSRSNTTSPDIPHYDVEPSREVPSDLADLNYHENCFGDVNIDDFLFDL